MDTNSCDPSTEESEPSSYDFDELIKGITRDSVPSRLKYTPNFKRHDRDHGRNQKRLTGRQRCEPYRY